jgi:hypothetical protein
VLTNGKRVSRLAFPKTALLYQTDALGGLHHKERPPLKQKDSKMNIQNSIDEQREMATGTDAAVAERKRLAQCGFTSEEIGSVLWLRQWYQSGGSDRVAMVRHWEFLKLLVMHGQLES